MSEEPTGRELDAAIAKLRGMDTMQGQYSDWLISSPDSPTWNRIPEWHGKDAMELLVWWIGRGNIYNLVLRNTGTKGLWVRAETPNLVIDPTSDIYTDAAETPARITQAIYRALKAQQEAS